MLVYTSKQKKEKQTCTTQLREIFTLHADYNGTFIGAHDGAKICSELVTKCITTYSCSQKLPKFTSLWGFLVVLQIHVPVEDN